MITAMSDSTATALISVIGAFVAAFLTYVSQSKKTKIDNAQKESEFVFGEYKSLVDDLRTQLITEREERKASLNELRLYNEKIIIDLRKDHEEEIRRVREEDQNRINFLEDRIRLLEDQIRGKEPIDNE